MFRSLLKRLVRLSVLLAAILLGGGNVALAQSPPVSTLDGVSYSEMAEWQSRYGGGPFYHGACGPAYGGPVYMEQFYAPAPCVPRKMRKRGSRR
jgi:hypothetical protein